MREKYIVFVVPEKGTHSMTIFHEQMAQGMIVAMVTLDDARPTAQNKGKDWDSSFAICNPSDQFNYQTGLKLAVNRALKNLRGNYWERDARAELTRHAYRAFRVWLRDNATV